MTVSATATTEFDVDTQIAVALRSIGMLGTDPGQEAKPGDLLLGRQLLLLGLRALANDGIILRARERVSVTLTAETAYADMAADTLSVEDGGILRNVDGTTDRPIHIYTIAEYQRLPNKTIAGVPNFYYPEKLSTGIWRVYFYPVPVVDYPTFIVPRTRKLRDVDTGNLTLDLEDKYHLAVNKFLAGHFARAKGRRDLANDVLSEYAFELERAQNDETPRGGGSFVQDDSPWDF